MNPPPPTWLTWSQARDLCIAHGVKERGWIRLSAQVRKSLLRGTTQNLYRREDLIRLLQVKES